MTTIIGIGGGDIRKAATLPIDKEIIRLSGKRHPQVLFIPTASSDSESYWQHFRNYYGKKLGCSCDVLFLIKEKPSFLEIKQKINTADVIYVGGGNTLKMMRLWRRLQVDKLLKAAWKKGTILCGVSAGSICWFEYGHSDSLSYYNPRRWKYIKVKGLGFVKGIHCPHYDSATFGKKRKDYFARMIQRKGGFGIAVDNQCALVYIDGKMMVLPAAKGKGAYVVKRKKGKVSKLIEEKVKEAGIWGLARKTKIGTSGSSLDVKVPKAIADILQLRKGQEVLIEPTEKNKIEITVI